MQNLRVIVLTIMSLVFWGFSSSADLKEMSLQERMKQADAVVIGEILESRNTGKETEFGVERWLATCRVERYIKGPKIYNPDSEEAKAVRLIRIAFKHRLQTPMLVKLVAGKKYLLFLKETGPNEYEMVTPYHGAFEAGQDYFVHDEQSPEYPQAVKMSFDEIVQRVTQKNPAPEPSQALTLFIYSDKEVYEPGEEIVLGLRFKNTGNKSLWLFTKMLPNADLKLAVYRMDGDNRVDVSPPILIDIIRQIVADADFEELLPQEVFSKQITLKEFSKELVLARGAYEISVELALSSYLFNHVKIMPWTGSIHSNTIKFEIKQSASLSFLSDVPEFQEFHFYMSESEIREIAQRNSLVLEGDSQKGFLVMNKDGETLALSMSEGKCRGIQRLPKQIKVEPVIDIRQQLYYAVEYWYGYMRDKIANEAVRMTSPALPKLHKEGEWTIWEFLHHHGRTTHRVLSRFLNAEETKIEGIQLTLNGIKAFLRSSIPSEVEEGIREIEILTGLNLKDNVCSSPERCLKWIESNEDYWCWDDEKNILTSIEIKEGRLPERITNLGTGMTVRGLRLSLAADKAVYTQNEPIVLTVKLKNIWPMSGKVCAVFPVNARMLIHSEIVFDVRNEKGEYVHFLPPGPPPPLTTKDFKRLDGGQSLESQEEITSRLHQKPLAPGIYHIQATYQNYELGKTLGLSPSCAGGSVLLEGGPAWTGRIFSNTITIEVTASTEPATSAMPQPLVIVALNNDDGGIFNFLPVAEFKNGFEKFFGTPHGLNFAAAAQMFDLNYANPQTAEEFVRTYKIALESKTSTLIEVTSDRKQNAAAIRGSQEKIRKVLGDRL